MKSHLKCISSSITPFQELYIWVEKLRSVNHLSQISKENISVENFVVNGLGLTAKQI